MGLWFLGLGTFVIGSSLLAQGCDDKDKTPIELCRNPNYSSTFESKRKNSVWIPLDLYRLTQENGSGGQTRASLQKNIQDLNKAYEPVGYQFFVRSFQDIKNNKLYSGAGRMAPIDFNNKINSGLLAETPLEGGVRIFVLNDSTPCGQALYGNVGFKVGKFCGSGTWIHEMGHYLGLRHPHPDLAQGPEPADGSSCGNDEVGDGLCSTPPDPHPPYEQVDPTVPQCEVNDKCEIVSCPTDENGVEYKPNVKLYMGYYGNCGSEFTEEQMNVMRCVGESVITGLQKFDAPHSVLEKPEVSVGCSEDDQTYPSVNRALEEVSIDGKIKLCKNSFENIVGNGFPFHLEGWDKHVTKLWSKGGRIMNLPLSTGVTKISKISLENSEDSKGGIMYASATKKEEKPTLVLEEVALWGGKAMEGGCLYASGVDLELKDVYIQGCEAFEEGGGIAMYGGSLLASGNNQAYGNSAEFGGAFFLKDTHPVNLELSAKYNTARNRGGVFYFSDGKDITLSNFTLSKNISPMGPAIYVVSRFDPTKESQAIPNNITLQNGLIQENDSSPVEIPSFEKIGLGATVIAGNTLLKATQVEGTHQHSDPDIQIGEEGKPGLNLFQFPEDDTTLTCSGETMTCESK